MNTREVFYEEAKTGQLLRGAYFASADDVRTTKNVWKLECASSVLYSKLQAWRSAQNEG